jgi:RNA polymerase sigma factor (sigma-70 family)
MNDLQKKIEKEVLGALKNKGDIRPLITNYGNLIRNVIRKTFMMRFIAYSEMEIEDIEQEVYINLLRNNFKRIIIFEPEKGSLVSWLKLIAYQTASAAIRKTQDALYPSHRKNLDSIDDKNKHIVFEEVYSEESRFDAREKLTMLDTAVNDLDESKQTIFKLKFYDNVETLFIAELENKTKKAIESLLYRIKEDLKEQIDKKFNE